MLDFLCLAALNFAMPMDIKQIADHFGGVVAMSLKLGLSRAAASQWDEIPVEHVLNLAEMTEFKVTPHQMRPDYYPHPQDGLPDHMRAAA